MPNSFYQRLTKQALALIESEPDLIANLANISALLNMEMEDINWVGFYLLKHNIDKIEQGADKSDTELVLGPFQGNPACVRIPVGRGVCGTAVSQQKTLRIEDVHAFEGHIACDANSNSEIVVPFYINREGENRGCENRGCENRQCVGVLDIDSPSLARFNESDEEGLTFMMKELEKVL